VERCIVAIAGVKAGVAPLRLLNYQPLVELTVGAQMAVRAGAWSRSPPKSDKPVWKVPTPWIAVIGKQIFSPSELTCGYAFRCRCDWQRAGHKRADQSHLFGVSDAAIQEDVAICGGKAVGVSVVNFKLTISILVVNLIDIKANSLQAGDQLFNVGTTAGQSLVVITRFIQGVGPS